MVQLLKGIEDLKTAMVKTVERPARYRDSHHIWCDSADHIHRDYEDLKEALQCDMVYYEGGRSIPWTLVNHYGQISGMEG